MEIQPLSLDFGCEDWVALHEGMHALGWWHEQQRGDRDNHIILQRENCYLSDSAWQVNFGKLFEKWNNDGHADL